MKTYLKDDNTTNGSLVDELNQFDLSLSLDSTIIIDHPSYVLEDDLS